MNLGKELKVFRKKTKLSQLEFSEKIGSTQQCISSYERGITEPSIELLIRIAKVFHCSIDEVIGFQRGELEREALELLGSMTEEQRILSIQILKTIYSMGLER